MQEMLFLLLLFTDVAALKHFNKTLQGAGVFLAGNALQFWSHWILACLRRSTPMSTQNEKEFYQTPTGKSNIVQIQNTMSRLIILPCIHPAFEATKLQ